MNRYRIRFTATCPVNKQTIDYELEIETQAQIAVEEILGACHVDEPTLHEPLADKLHAEFGGRQTLRAHHHGVDIETVRG